MKPKMLNKDSIIVCDECEKEFGYLDIKIKEKKLKDKCKTAFTYYCCPICNESYLINVTDMYIRRDMKELKNLKEKYNHKFYNKKCANYIDTRKKEIELQELKEEIEQKQAIISSRCNDLKEECKDAYKELI